MGIQALQGHASGHWGKIETPIKFAYMTSTGFFRFQIDNWLSVRRGSISTVGHRILAVDSVPPGARRCQRIVHRGSRDDADESH